MRSLDASSLILCAALAIVPLIPTTSASETDRNDAIMEMARENIQKYRKGNLTVRVGDEDGNPVNGAIVRLEQTRHHFQFGSIVFELLRENHLSEEQAAIYRERFSNLFNLAVFPFYWEGYEYRAGQPAWQATARVVEWCQSMDISCKGHPLAWTHPAGTPPWIYEMPPEYSQAMLQSRILRNVHGYKGRIDHWDVVNEASNTVTWEAAMRLPKRTNDPRYGAWQTSVQSVADWVEPCYRWAFLANPKAELILNDFGQIAFPAIRERFYQLVVELQSREVPLTGIGLQAHEPRLMWYFPEEVWETLEYYQSLDLPIHMTEFHPHSSGAPIEGGFRQGNWNLQTQAEYAEQMIVLAFGHPGVVSFSWWDFTEKDAYIKGSALLDENLRPKPAYHTLDRLINHEWKSRHSGKSDTHGAYSERVFYGNYEVRIRYPDGEEKTVQFHHSPRGPGILTIRR